MESKKQNLSEVKKAKGNLIELTVKDVTKIQGGRAVEKSAKRAERNRK